MLQPRLRCQEWRERYPTVFRAPIKHRFGLWESTVCGSVNRIALPDLKTSCCLANFSRSPVDLALLREDNALTLKIPPLDTSGHSRDPLTFFLDYKAHQS